MTLPSNAARDAVEPFEAAEHLRNLRRRGVPQSVLAQASGLSERHLSQIMAGGSRWLHADTADRILCIGLSALKSADKGKIDSTESKRLVAEMVAAGWSKGWICKQIGCTTKNKLHMGKRILASRARRIRQLHDQLWWTNEVGRKLINHGHVQTGVAIRSVCRCYGRDPALEQERQRQAERRARKKEGVAA